MIPMNNPQQYQIYNQDDDNNKRDLGEMVSPQMKARMSFEAVEEPIKFMIRNEGFGLFNGQGINGFTVPTPEAIMSFSPNIGESFNQIRTGISTMAQMDGRGVTNFVVKKSAGVWAKALEVAARVGR
jgi:hypothetical protein